MGAFIAKPLDELPQLFNVLRGNEFDRSAALPEYFTNI
jgi:hypothetical protein